MSKTLVILRRKIGCRSNTLLLICFCLLTAGAARVTAQDQGWAPPAQVSGTTQTSWFPDIAIGPDGSVHIVWASGIARGDEATDQVDLVLYSTLAGGRWSKPNDIVNPGTGGFASRSSIAMGHDGQLHLLVRSQLRIDYMRAPLDKASSVQGWSQPRKISNLSTTYYDALAIDSQGTLHAVWNESVPRDPALPDSEEDKACPSCSDLYYRASTDGGKQWTAPVNLSQSPVGSAKPQLKIDANTNLHIVWDEGRDTIVGKGEPVAGMYRQSRDGGKTWDKPARFTLPPVAGEDADAPPRPDAPQQMALGLFQNHAPIVVYRATASGQVYFQFSADDGQTWSAAAPIAGVYARDLNDTPWDSYSMATDGAGNVHLLMTGFPAEDANPDLNLRRTDQRTRPRLLHLVWDGTQWSQPEVVATDDRYPGWSAETIEACDAIDPNSAASRTKEGQAALKACQLLERYPEWPRVAISGSTLHLAWFTRNGVDRFDSDHAGYQVWYSALPLDAPAVAPLLQFTPVPTVAPVQPTPTLPPAPTPTLAPNAVQAPQLSGPAGWELPGMVVLGLAALPVIGLLALVIVARALVLRRRRRI